MTFLKEADYGYITVDFPAPDLWIQVVDPDPAEQERLKAECGVDPDFLSDILDIDELSRIEKTDDGFQAILRIPVYDPDREFSYFTVPYGIISRPGQLITICLVDNPVNQDLANRRIRDLKLMNGLNVILNVILRASLYYLRFLKDIHRKTAVIERDLHKSIKNDELAELLRFQKSLVYFTTSIRSNELLPEKIHKLSAWRLDEDEQETLEDARIELRQAMEMANIHSNILSGTVDTFASVISNNANTVMKRLTLVSLTLMIPTLLASLYGMNVPLPFQHEAWAFWAIVGAAVVTALTAMLFFRKKSMFH